MLLYHGSNLPIEKPLLLPASHPTDFGIGFYIFKEAKNV
jgi:hypothetical protein